VCQLQTTHVKNGSVIETNNTGKRGT